MTTFRSECVIAVMILFSATAADGWTSKTSDDSWRNGWGQGWAEADVTHGSGNEIYLACESGSGLPSSVSFELAGRKASPNSDILMIFDKERPESIQVNDKGLLTADCRACAANFEYVVQKLKSHSSVFVRFVDGRESTFTLKGAAKAIGDCKPGWP